MPGGTRTFDRSQLLDVEEMAATFNTTAASLYVQRNRGTAPGSLAVRVGKRLYWHRADLEAWWNSQLEGAAR